MKAMVLFCSLLLFFNLMPLLSGAAQTQWMWSTEAGGIHFFTHPWVHTSPYHLLLDAGAFLSLWCMLRCRPLVKICLWLGANAGSVVGAHLSGLHQVSGFCGLSGIAHGLLAFLALDWMIRGATAPERNAGAVTLTVLLGKSLFEAATGQVFLAGLHLGDVGTPLAACHLGGVAGALLIYLLTELRPNRSAINRSTDRRIGWFFSSIRVE
jgi:hypothetical protein